MRGAIVKAFFLALAVAPLRVPAQARPQTQSDDYTRYELLAPGTAKFRILYEVTATTPGRNWPGMDTRSC